MSADPRDSADAPADPYARFYDLPPAAGHGAPGPGTEPDPFPPDDHRPAEPERRGHHRRWWSLGALVLVVVVVVVGAGYFFLPGRGEVAPGTRVAGIAVGGLDRTRLRATLDGPVAAKLDAPVRVTLGSTSTSYQVKPSALGITLDRAATEQTLLPDGEEADLPQRIRMLRGPHHDVAPVISVDEKAGEKALTALVEGFTRSPRDATMQLAVPTPKLTDKLSTQWTATSAGADVTSSRTGRGIDVEAGLSTVRAAVAAGRAAVVLPVVVTQPKVPSTAARSVDQLIGTFTTMHPCCQSRVSNIHRIATIVDGTVIPPGTQFSLNQRVGRRTAANGFVAAPAIADGELVSQVGGGVSQFSTTLFNAAWFAGLDVVRHQPHSKYISRYPPGREATLDYDTIDQVIRNDTGVPVVIRASYTGTSVTVALYGHTGNRTVVSTTGPRMPRSGGGFSISVVRQVQQDGATRSRDTLNWTYTGLD